MTRSWQQPSLSWRFPANIQGSNIQIPGDAPVYLLSWLQICIYIYIIYIYCLVYDTYIYLVVSGTETKLTSSGASPRCAVYGCIQLNDDFAFYGPRFEAWNHGWRAIWDWTFLKLLMGSQSHLQSIKSLEEGITKVIDARKSSVPRSENCHHHEGDSPQHHGHINWLTPWKLGPRLAAESNPVLNDLIIAGETSHYNVCMCIYIYIIIYPIMTYIITIQSNHVKSNHFKWWTACSLIILHTSPLASPIAAPRLLSWFDSRDPQGRRSSTQSAALFSALGTVDSPIIYSLDIQ